MKKILKALPLLALIVIGASSCDKTKTTSNQFISAGNWTVTEMTVDGTAEAELPTWEIKDCDIYAASCEAHWANEEGGETEFIWQFRDKGQTFEISHQGEDDHGHDHDHDHGHGHDHAAIEAALQAYNFSGVYEVVESSKDMMHFQSTVVIGHSGKTVLIKISKK